MKWNIKQWLFKSELDSYYKIINKKIKELDHEKETVRKEFENHNSQYGLAKRVFILFPNGKILGIETNKNGEELYVIEVKRDSKFDIILLGKSYPGITHLPRIQSTINTVAGVKKSYVKISDVQMIDNSLGHGSIAMKYFLSEVEKLNVGYVEGWLSPVDKENFIRSEGYYKKHGFNVTFDENKTSGSVKKEF